MAEHQYYSEEVLIEKMERGEYGRCTRAIFHPCIVSPSL